MTALRKGGVRNRGTELCCAVLYRSVLYYVTLSLVHCIMRLLRNGWAVLDWAVLCCAENTCAQ